MKKAIVVGATSGIGKALANSLVHDGYIVGITGRRTTLLEEIKAKSPASYCIKSFDISKTDSISINLIELVQELNGLDLLIISAGTGKINKELNFDIEKHTIDTNVSGFTAVANWAFNYFQKQKQGHIAVITSIGGLRGNSQAPSYSASKAYQINYIESLRIKSAKSKKPIFITDIRPGFVDTEMAKGEGLFWVSNIEKATKQIYKAIQTKKKIVYITKRWGILGWFLKRIPSWILDRI